MAGPGKKKQKKKSEGSSSAPPAAGKAATSVANTPVVSPADAAVTANEVAKAQPSGAGSTVGKSSPSQELSEKPTRVEDAVPSKEKASEENGAKPLAISPEQNGDATSHSLSTASAGSSSSSAVTSTMTSGPVTSGAGHNVQDIESEAGKKVGEVERGAEERVREARAELESLMGELQQEQEKNAEEKKRAEESAAAQRADAEQNALALEKSAEEMKRNEEEMERLKAELAKEREEVVKGKVALVQQQQVQRDCESRMAEASAEKERAGKKIEELTIAKDEAESNLKKEQETSARLATEAKEIGEKVKSMNESNSKMGDVVSELESKMQECEKRLAAEQRAASDLKGELAAVAKEASEKLAEVKLRVNELVAEVTKSAEREKAWEEERRTWSSKVKAAEGGRVAAGGALANAEKKWAAEKMEAGFRLRRGREVLEGFKEYAAVFQNGNSDSSGRVGGGEANSSSNRNGSSKSNHSGNLNQQHGTSSDNTETLSLKKALKEKDEEVKALKAQVAALSGQGAGTHPQPLQAVNPRDINPRNVNSVPEKGEGERELERQLERAELLFISTKERHRGEAAGVLLAGSISGGMLAEHTQAVSAVQAQSAVQTMQAIATVKAVESMRAAGDELREKVGSMVEVTTELKKQVESLKGRSAGGGAAEVTAGSLGGDRSETAGNLSVAGKTVGVGENVPMGVGLQQQLERAELLFTSMKERHRGEAAEILKGVGTPTVCAAAGLEAVAAVQALGALQAESAHQATQVAETVQAVDALRASEGDLRKKVEKYETIMDILRKEVATWRGNSRYPEDVEGATVARTAGVNVSDHSVTAGSHASWQGGAGAPKGSELLVLQQLERAELLFTLSKEKHRGEASAVLRNTEGGGLRHTAGGVGSSDGTQEETGRNNEGTVASVVVNSSTHMVPPLGSAIGTTLCTPCASSDLKGSEPATSLKEGETVPVHRENDSLKGSDGGEGGGGGAGRGLVGEMRRLLESKEGMILELERKVREMAKAAAEAEARAAGAGAEGGGGEGGGGRGGGAAGSSSGPRAMAVNGGDTHLERLLRKKDEDNGYLLRQLSQLKLELQDAQEQCERLKDSLTVSRQKEQCTASKLMAAVVASESNRADTHSMVPGSSVSSGSLFTTTAWRSVPVVAAAAAITAVAYSRWVAGRA